MAQSQTMQRIEAINSRQLLSINLVLASLFLLAGMLQIWSQPIIADEVDFVRAATNWDVHRGLIPHPPTYVHLLQLCFWLFGESVEVARLPGIVSGFVTLFLIPPLASAILGHSTKTDWISSVAVWLYAINPLTLQNMVLLDIDNTILIPALLGLLLLWYHLRAAKLQTRLLLLSVAFAAALWIKLPTPPLLLGSLGLFYLLRRRLAQVFEIAAIGLLGGLLFAATFALYGQLTGFTFVYMAKTFAKAPSASRLGDMLVWFPQGLGVFTFWLSLPQVVLLGVAVVQFFNRLVKQKLQRLDMLIIYTGIVTFFFALVLFPAWGFPRYHAVIVPVIAVIVASIIWSVWQQRSRPVLVTALVIGVVTLIYNLAIVGDPLWSLYYLTFETVTGDLRERLLQGVASLALTAVPLIAGLVIGAGVAVRLKLNQKTMALATLSALMIANLLATTLVQINADYSTRYRYTLRFADLYQAAEDVRQHVDPSGYILATHEILYLAQRPGDLSYYGHVCPTCTAAAFLERLRTQRIDAMVWTEKDDYRAPQVVQDPAVVSVLEHCYTPKTHGVFLVYLYAPDLDCPLDSVKSQ